MKTARIDELCAQHYERVGPLLEASLGSIPVASASFPNGFEKPAQWHVGLHDPPPAVATVQAATPSGTHTYLALHDRALAWAAHHFGAVEFYSWAPRPDDFERPAFGRILLEPAGNTPPQALHDAAHIVRRVLAKFDFDAIVMLDGHGSLALWLPVTDTTFDAMSLWLHQLAARIASDHPTLFVTQPHAHGDGLVRIAVAKNAPGTFTALPYSARGLPHLPVCLPVHWEELHTIADGSVTVETLPARLEKAGDVFALERARIGPQSFNSVILSLSKDPEHVILSLSKDEGSAELELELAAPRYGHVISAALEILNDGKTRSAEQILSEAIARKLLPTDFNQRYVYTSLIEYITRARGGDRKPAIVQDEHRNFRINEPLDDWPALPDTPAAPPDVQTQGLIERLTKTATGSDPAAFEIAVCDAFAHLGFATTHVGGLKAPDGYADAQLGPLGYRVMIECKTAKQDVSQPDAFEAAKYRDAFHAQYCTLIGPAFPNEIELTSELHTHGVSAWTLDDLKTALTIAANAHELRACFEPGYAADALTDLIWERHHGERKRILTVANLIRTTGWHLQTLSAGLQYGVILSLSKDPEQRGGAAHVEGSTSVTNGAATNGAVSANGATRAGDAALLTIDAAMVLVDEALAAAGSQRACTREETQLAFEYLTNPIVRQAVWTDASQSSIVILSS